MEKSNDKKILVVRPDRIGDVVLSTPVISALRKAYPRAHITFMTQAAIHPLLKDLPELDAVMDWQPKGRHAKIKGLFKLIEEFRAGNFEYAIVLHPHWKIAAALYGAKIPYRVGPLSKWYSYLFFNRGKIQRRSLVEMHEADYNLQLLSKMGVVASPNQFNTKIAVSTVGLEETKDWLKANGFKARQPLVVIHPGMGGSALNWPSAHYKELAKLLLSKKIQVLITAGPTENHVIEEMKDALENVNKETDTSYGFYGSSEVARKGQPTRPIDFLAGLYSHADVVVAPSTGPLHLAVALGKNVVTFYPPIRVQSAIRWGPYTTEETRASVLIPEVYCGQDFKCLGKKCTYFLCMRMITVGQVIEEIQKQLKGA